MLKSSVTPANKERLLVVSWTTLRKETCYIIIFIIFYHLTFRTIDLQIYNVHLPGTISLKIVFSVSEKTVLPKERLLLPRVEWR